jgi:hypothetical protein
MVESKPFQTVLQIAGGHCLSRCPHVAADLAIADGAREFRLARDSKPVRGT